MRRILSVLAGAALIAQPASAQVLRDCAELASPADIVEPWEDHSRSYAEGAIRVALLEDADAPDCCARSLLILAPAGAAENGWSGRQCLVGAPDETRGFRDLDIGGIAASYSPHIGLTLSVPVLLHRDGTQSDTPAFPDRMKILIDQARGRVSVE